MSLVGFLFLWHLVALEHSRSLMFTTVKKLVQSLITELRAHFLYYRSPVTQHAGNIVIRKSQHFENELHLL
jgi:hypothetical protein